MLQDMFMIKRGRSCQCGADDTSARQLATSRELLSCSQGRAGLTSVVVSSLPVAHRKGSSRGGQGREEAPCRGEEAEAARGPEEQCRAGEGSVVERDRARHRELQGLPRRCQDPEGRDLEDLLRGSGAP
eukprot:12754469-Alexandrium_andersonii.AAC.2